MKSGTHTPGGRSVREGELLACPFCGAPASLFQKKPWSEDWRVCCDAGADRCPAFGDYATPAEAIAAWNRRAASQQSTSDTDLCEATPITVEMVEAAERANWADDEAILALTNAARAQLARQAASGPSDPDAGAKILAKFIGLAWDGITPDARPEGYPMWGGSGSGAKTYQGGKEGLREIAAAIAQQAAAPGVRGEEGMARAICKAVMETREESLTPGEVAIEVDSQWRNYIYEARAAFAYAAAPPKASELAAPVPQPNEIN